MCKIVLMILCLSVFIQMVTLPLQAAANVPTTGAVAGDVNVQNKQLDILIQQGNYPEALQLARNLYEFRLNSLGPNSPVTLLIMDKLAFILRASGQAKEALKLCEKVYQLRREMLGERHSSTLTSLNNVAVSLYDLGCYSEALAIQEKVYQLRKEVQGERHPDTLISLNNLATSLNSLGRYSEALSIQEKVYQLRKEVQGERHPDTLISLNNLATSLNSLGRYSEALSIHEKVYQLRKEVLGERHPATLTSLINLANTLSFVGRYSEALSIHEKVYQLCKEVLGERHPATLASLNSWAGSLKSLGRYSEALPLQEKVYQLRKEVLGERHPVTLESLNNWAALLSSLGRYSEALPLDEKEYQLCKEVLGERHPNTLKSMSNLAGSLYFLGRYNEALPLQEKVYQLRKEILGDQHPDTLASLIMLTYNYCKHKRYAEALPLFQEQIVGLERLRQQGGLTGESRNAFFSQYANLYPTAAFAAAFLGKTEEAFHIAELSRARTLMEMAAARMADQSSIISETERDSLRDYQLRLGKLDDLTGKAIAAGRLEEKLRIDVEKGNVQRNYMNFRQSLMDKYPKYRQLNEITILGSSSAREILATDSVFISYLQAGEGLLVFTVTATDGIAMDIVAPVPNLANLSVVYREIIMYATIEQMRAANRYLWRESTGKYTMTATREQQPAGSEPIRDDAGLSKARETFAIQMGDILLRSIAGKIEGKKRWIIAPDRVLALLPFDVLSFKGKLAVAEHDISYIQSLSMLNLLKQKEHEQSRENSKKDIFAMGGAIYGETASTGEQGEYTDTNKLLQVLQNTSITEAFGLIGRSQWRNLPGTEIETKRVQDIFGANRVDLYTGKDATEGKLQELNRSKALMGYKCILFSTHGYVDPKIPSLTAIVLGQYSNPPGIDGYVTVGEWPSYDLKSDLVYLSACNTGLGKIVGGEGVMGLSYALYIAGNRDTVTTLWAVNDEGTAVFTGKFFERLKAGQKPWQALSETKREMMGESGGRYRAPAYWAPFILYGI